MLGHSSAGKTTYMAALYYRMENGVYDYKMRYDVWTNYWYKHYTQNNMYYTIDEAIKEGEELKSTSIGVSKGKYPSPTEIKQEYVFLMYSSCFFPKRHTSFSCATGFSLLTLLWVGE